MYEALKNMFESNNTLRALTLKGQLQNIMTKADIVATFFMKISEIRDQLGAIGETISDREVVLTTLKAFPRHWEPFLQSISGRAELPTFDCLWTDCTQEEIRLIARGVQDSPHDVNHALVFHTKKGGRNRRSFSKAFKGKKTSSTSSYEHRKDKSKIQCFGCDKYGHIARDCPTRKKGRQLASTADVDLEHLTDLVEKESSLHVVLGDNARYNVKGVGTSTFQLDSDIPLQLSEVLYVLGMKRNLVSVSDLEDKGYKVTFSEGKVLAWHKNSNMNSSRVIGVRENKLYRFTI
jgi:hypothetical protein